MEEQQTSCEVRAADAQTHLEPLRSEDQKDALAEALLEFYANAGGVSSRQRGITEERLEELIREGSLTGAGQKRLQSNDVRCRPEKRYAVTYFAPGKLPQFRLATTEDAAHGEDCVMLWAHLSGKEPVLREGLFRFEPEMYMKDLELVGALRLIISAEQMETFLKRRYGTARVPKRRRAGRDLVGEASQPIITVHSEAAGVGLAPAAAAPLQVAAEAGGSAGAAAAPPAAAQQAAELRIHQQQRWQQESQVETQLAFPAAPHGETVAALLNWDSGGGPPNAMPCVWLPVPPYHHHNKQPEPVSPQLGPTAVDSKPEHSQAWEASQPAAPAPTASAPATTEPLADVAEVPPEVTARLLSANLDNKLSMAGALVSLFRAGVGGGAMNTLALLFSGSRLSLEEQQFHFALIRDYIAMGQVSEAVGWVEEWVKFNT